MAENVIKIVGLVLTKEQEELLKNGQLIRTNGVLRDVKTMEIKKHLDMIDLPDDSSWKEFKKIVARVIKENGKVVTIIGIGSLTVGAFYGIRFHNKKKKEKVLEEKYNLWINKVISDYIGAAVCGELTIDHINECEEVLKSFQLLTDKIFISLNLENKTEIINKIKDYTQRLAKVHLYEIGEDKNLDYDENFVNSFLNNLEVQKEIMCHAA